MRYSLFGRLYIFGDALSWVIAFLLAAWFRFELQISELNITSLILVGLAVGAAHLVIGVAGGLYRRLNYATFDEIRALALYTAFVGAAATVLLFVFGLNWDVPRSTALIATPIAFLGMCGFRYVSRSIKHFRNRPGADAKVTILYGAGYLAETVIRRMQSDGDSNFRPVALIDDDPSKMRRHIRGVRVMGNIDALKKVAVSTGATDLIITIGRADASLIRRISEAAKDAGLNAMVLPSFDGILAGKTNLSDLRDISIEDLIGRNPVDTEVASIAGYLAGKKVLVTGAGGSIGSELCHQILKYAPAELIMLDRDETGLQEAQLGTVGHGLLHTRDVVLADIRDIEALTAIFEDRRPDVVFHAAALKHLPMLEQYPDEAWKTNVIGTLNVLQAANLINVETFVNISTDKAANPTSVLGHSKRVAEKLTAWMASTTDKPYISVRFGNVIGSRGSMLPTFRRLIEAGGPVTVTHPDITRYFMTIPEACQLVVQAGGIGRAGEVLILDMGEPIKIMDVAQQMIEMSGKDIEIVFTGLREGEKMHEVLIGQNEVDTRPFHPKISHARVKPMSPEQLDKGGWELRMANQSDTAEMRVAESKTDSLNLTGNRL
ncbi:polysaccharide biosynthesis protein [Paeniglutamicibacter antarcticus]